MSSQIPLGEPLPNNLHAVSVSLPAWDDVIGYEEARLRTIMSMKLGYPRFFYHPITKELFAECEKRYANIDEFCRAFPSEKVAAKAVEFCEAGKIYKFSEGVFAVTLPKGYETTAKAFWMHTGLIVSSRRAEHALRKPTEYRLEGAGKAAKENIRSQIAQLTKEKLHNVFLYPSGMAAIFSAFELVKHGSTIQLGFPYVDTLKIQEKFGQKNDKKTFFIDYKSEADFAELEKMISENNISAVFTEFPCNPLITCVDLKKLSEICRKNKVALIIDDTLSSWANVNLQPYADIVVSSLTKFYSGVGDVMAGSLVLNSASPIYRELKAKIDVFYEDLLFDEDAEVLEKNGQGFEARMAKINANAEGLAAWLKTKPQIKQIYYTKGNPVYEKYIEKGYGGIISIVLENERSAQKFYDAVEVNKGPSLGTNYTLICPYTMLAHYHEREFAEKCGVSFHLIRISVGMEEVEELKNKFEAALNLV